MYGSKCQFIIVRQTGSGQRLAIDSEAQLCIIVIRRPAHESDAPVAVDVDEMVEQRLKAIPIVDLYRRHAGHSQPQTHQRHRLQAGQKLDQVITRQRQLK